MAVEDNKKYLTYKGFNEELNRHDNAVSLSTDVIVRNLFYITDVYNEYMDISSSSSEIIDFVDTHYNHDDYNVFDCASVIYEANYGDFFRSIPLSIIKNTEAWEIIENSAFLTTLYDTYNAQLCGCYELINGTRLMLDDGYLDSCTLLYVFQIFYQGYTMFLKVIYEL